MGKITDRDKLTTQIKGTLEFEFGACADNVGEALRQINVSPSSLLATNILKRIRDAGNNSIRVINNHVDNYNVSYKKKDTINASRLAEKAMEQANEHSKI